MLFRRMHALEIRLLAQQESGEVPGPYEAHALTRQRISRHAVPL